MFLRFRIVGAVAIALLLSGCDGLIDPPPDVIYLISEDFSGWMCVDFEVENAPALPREGKAMLVRPRAGEVLETSEKEPGWRSEVWVEVGSERSAASGGMGTGVLSESTLLAGWGTSGIVQRAVTRSRKTLFRCRPSRRDP